MKRAERWKPIPGWPLYAASDQGQIKRTGRGNTQYPGEKILAISKGYVNTSRGAISAAYLILLAFRGPPPGPYGGVKGCYLSRHLNDDRSNNQLNNLAWGTKSDNAKDAIRNGRMNTPQHKAKTAAIWKGKKLPKTIRRKLSIARQNRVTKETTREKYRARWKDPAYRKMMLKAQERGRETRRRQALISR